MISYLELTEASTGGRIVLNADRIITFQPAKPPSLGTAISLDRVILTVSEPYDQVKELLFPAESPKVP